MVQPWVMQWAGTFVLAAVEEARYRGESVGKNIDVSTARRRTHRLIQPMCPSAPISAGSEVNAAGIANCLVVVSRGLTGRRSRR